MGLAATFIRFSGCNLSCSYCDTDHESWTPLTLEDILDRVGEAPERVVITGGEPLLSGEGLVELAKAITATGRSVDLETNGTIAPPEGLAGLIDNYVISPKLSNSGNPESERQLAPYLPEGPLKFVVDDITDLQEVGEVVEVVDSLPGRDIIIMPQSTDPVDMMEKIKRLDGPVLSRGWRLMPRLQVLLGLR